MQIILRPHTEQPGNIADELTALDDLAHLGVRADHPKLKPARKHATRVVELRAQAEHLRSVGAEQLTAEVVTEYAAGKIDPEDLAAHVARIQAADPANETLQRILDRAEAQVSREGHEVCRSLGDLWLTEILRPAVDRAMEPLTDELVDQAWRGLLLQPHALKHDRQARAAMEQVEDVIAALDELANVAITWRNYGWVPTPPARHGHNAEDYRWRRRDLLGPTGQDYRVFFLQSVRAGAEHGVWTADEVTVPEPVSAA